VRAGTPEADRIPSFILPADRRNSLPAVNPILSDHTHDLLVSFSSFSAPSPAVCVARCELPLLTSVFPVCTYVRCHGRRACGALAAVLLVLCAKTGVRFPDRSRVLPRLVFLPRHARSCVSSRRPSLCGVLSSASIRKTFSFSSVNLDVGYILMRSFPFFAETQAQPSWSVACFRSTDPKFESLVCGVKSLIFFAYPI
jgi:hypothetical protein